MAQTNQFLSKAGLEKLIQLIKANFANLSEDEQINGEWTFNKGIVLTDIGIKGAEPPIEGQVWDTNGGKVVIEDEIKKSETIQAIQTAIEGKLDKGELDDTLFSVVTELPSTNIKQHIYLKKTGDTANNKYAEYIYTGNLPINETNVYNESNWEKLGELSAKTDLTGYAKLDAGTETNLQTFTGHNKFSKIIQSSGIKSAEDATLEDKHTGSVKAWTTDGKVIDLSDYASLVAAKYPFKFKTFGVVPNGTIEYTGTAITPTISWTYENDRHKITEQKITGNGLTKTADPSDRQKVWDAVIPEANTPIKFSMVSKADGGSKTAEPGYYVSITAVHRSYSGTIPASQSTITADQIKQLSESKVVNGKSRTVTIATNYSKGVFCYPTYFGTLNSIILNNMNGISGYDVITVNDVNGTSYYAYIQKVADTSTNSYTLK